jgi:hypothetical protein
MKMLLGNRVTCTSAVWLSALPAYYRGVAVFKFSYSVDGSFHFRRPLNIPNANAQRYLQNRLLNVCAYLSNAGGQPAKLALNRPYPRMRRKEFEMSLLRGLLGPRWSSRIRIVRSMSAVAYEKVLGQATGQDSDQDTSKHWPPGPAATNKARPARRCF